MKNRFLNILIILCTLFFMNQLVYAQWTPLQRVTWSYTDSWSPKIYVDGSYDIHLVWIEYIPGNGEIFYKKTTGGGTSWTTRTRLTWTAGNSQETFFIPGTGKLHVTWVDDSSGNDEIYYKNSSDNGTTWSTSQRLTWNTGDSRTPCLAADMAFGVHLVWVDDCTGNDEIYYKKSTDNGSTWSAPRRLTWNPGISSYPHIIEVFGSLHVVWSDVSSGGWEIYYKKSLNLGATWSSPIRLTYNSGNSWRPVMTVTSNQKLHLVWYDGTPGNDEIFYKRSDDTGKTWGGPVRLTWNMGYSRHPKLSCDKNGNLDLVWFDSTFGNEEIFYKTGNNEGSSWTVPVRLTWNTGLSSWPEVDTDFNTVTYVVWQDSTPGNWEILLKTQFFFIPAGTK